MLPQINLNAHTGDHGDKSILSFSQP